MVRTGPPDDARILVATYERLLERRNVLVMARSRQDRALLQRHTRWLEERLAFWTLWR